MRTENKRFHLQLIEDTITRMSSNSFLIKVYFASKKCREMQ